MVNIQSVRTQLSRVSKLTYLMLFVVVWLLAALYAWFHVVYQSPERVFQGMLRNNFSTQGYVREAVSTQGNVTSDEATQLLLGKEPMVLSATTLKQGGDEVNTSTITTSQKNYVRYTKIKTERKDKDGRPLAFDKVIGVWAVGDSQGTGTSQAVSQLMLGLIPIGNVSAKDKQDLLDKIAKTKAISTDYKNVKKETKDGRSVYTYSVKIKPVPYLQMLKQFGNAAGLGDQVKQLNPDDYKDTPEVTVEVKVDARSRHLVSTNNVGQQGAASELYSGFGIRKGVTLPERTITTDQLQQRLNVQ
jgi:hypothetical protein